MTKPTELEPPQQLTQTEIMQNKATRFKLLVIVVSALVIGLSAGVLGYFLSLVDEAETELYTDRIALVAEELNINQTEIIREATLKGYDTFLTPKGTYKATFDYVDHKTVMLSFVKAPDTPDSK